MSSSPNPKEFGYEIMALDGVSISRDEKTDEGGLYTITCENHDAESTIETEDVCDLLAAYEMPPKNVIADFDAGKVVIEVEGP